MKRLFLALFMLLPLAADPLLFYSRKFPGSRPEYLEVRLTPDGKAEYRETPDEEPLVLKLTAEEAGSYFDLARKLDCFKREVESGLPVARMGDKVFRWTDGAVKNEAKFNYSQDAEAQALQDLFEKIAETGQLYYLLERTVKYDRIGAHQAILKVEAQWDKKRLAAPAQFIPLLNRVAKNDVYLNMARERAAKLVEMFSGKPVEAGVK